MGAAFAVLAIIWPARYGGISTFAVVSGPSMEPTFMPGQGAYVAWMPTGYGVGDVIVFTPEQAGPSGARVIHRIVAVNPDGTFVTKGDNKEMADPWRVSPDSVDGRVLLRLPVLPVHPVVLGSAGFFAALMVFLPDRKALRRRRGSGAHHG